MTSSSCCQHIASIVVPACTRPSRSSPMLSFSRPFSFSDSFPSHAFFIHFCITSSGCRFSFVLFLCFPSSLSLLLSFPSRPFPFAFFFLLSSSFYSSCFFISPIGYFHQCGFRKAKLILYNCTYRVYAGFFKYYTNPTLSIQKY